MKAMVLRQIKEVAHDTSSLELVQIPVPSPEEGELLLRITRCGVCHTELDEIEGRAAPSLFPIIPGHQIIGRVEKTDRPLRRFRQGDRVGIAWIHSSCGKCRFCRGGMENLCGDFKATGRDAHGGYAEYGVFREEFAFKIPDIFSDSEAAPLLCAGAIGYRSLRLAEIRNGETIGLTGFGASAHLVLEMIRHRYPDSRVLVFSRTASERDFARQMGANWAGDTTDMSPEKLQAVIDTTPAWKPVVEALKNLEKGGRLVINAIRKEDRDKDCLQEIDYERHLWMERQIKSVANITRKDVEEFLLLAAEIPLRPEIQEFPLEDANIALLELKERKIRGAKVLRIGQIS